MTAGETALNCDCYPGCWEDHVKSRNWPKLSIPYPHPKEVRDVLFKDGLYGTYVFGKIDEFNRQTLYVINTDIEALVLRALARGISRKNSAGVTDYPYEREINQ